ncbi:hypothetical protein ID47_08065 [Candidatus Paracaedibacter acanthamoebae]|uniref:Uncharacterized protein n=1 Tax=Candidatus Odyssella acanthamoebae TaxID=91604 RepID=A0A077AW98_9PROT|nr:hypothetical protein ID47_08065 [Candidatus Paracaedibacter acanthamoebae]
MVTTFAFYKDMTYPCSFFLEVSLKSTDLWLVNSLAIVSWNNFYKHKKGGKNPPFQKSTNGCFYFAKVF